MTLSAGSSLPALLCSPRDDRTAAAESVATATDGRRVTVKHPVPAGSARLGPVRLGPARIGSVWIRSDRPGGGTTSGRHDGVVESPSLWSHRPETRIIVVDRRAADGGDNYTPETGKNEFTQSSVASLM